MNIKKIVLTIISFVIATSINAQQYYTDTAFAQAINNGTRTNLGIPGPNYKTNFAHYKINAVFNTIEGRLSGEETITYDYNCGQNPLNSIVINLYRNIYKDGVTKHRYINPRDKSKGVIIEEIKLINKNETINLEYQEFATQIEATLPYLLQQGNKITLYIKWNTKIAAYSHLRGGKYNKDTWFVPYFYPQIAVYDDIYGWDRVQHTGNEEFYFENANYDVTITTDNYTATWATGILQNPETIYTKEVLTKYKKALSSNQITDIITETDIAKHAVKKEKNQWHFRADSVPDFVFCCSASSCWTAKTFKITPNRKVTASTVYRNNKFRNNTELAQQTINYLSTKIPGVPYPYPMMTIFEGSGGMEFPMMVNEDLNPDYDDMMFTTTHEITHTYYPFLISSNQNSFGYIDEGLTMYVPQYFQDSIAEEGTQIEKAVYYANSIFGTTDEKCVQTPSYKMNQSKAFAMASYYTPQIGYYILEGIIGPNAMKQALKQFTTVWSKKHAHPYDFFYTLENISGKDLSFFYNNWFATTGRADIGIKNVYREDSTNYIVLENLGEKYVPATVKITYINNNTETIYQSAEIWQNSNNSCTLVLPGPEIKSVDLITNDIPDQNKNNNNYIINK